MGDLIQQRDLRMTQIPTGIENKGLSWGWLTILLSIVTLILAGITIGFELTDTEVGVYIFKPLTTVTIIIIALIALQPPAFQYKWMILFGLGFSLIGDILLMLPQDLFLFGLIAFLVAQIFYTIAFSSVKGFYTSVIGAIPFLIFGLIMGFFLWPNLGEMRIPTIVYLVVILVMGWQAFGQWRQTGERRALLAFVGALLFILSDSLLAINRFATPLELARLLVLGTYYPAQWLISLSTGSEHP
jgi:uncharacterized membrane protein YhhN